MRHKFGTRKPSAGRIVRDIRRKTRKRHSTELKVGIVLSGLRGEDSIAEKAIKHIARLNGVEKAARGQPSDEQAKIREDKAKPIFDDLDAQPPLEGTIDMGNPVIWEIRDQINLPGMVRPVCSW